MVRENFLEKRIADLKSRVGKECPSQRNRVIEGLEVDLTALFNELKYQHGWRGDHGSVHKAPVGTAYVDHGKGPGLCPEGTGEPGRGLSREGLWALGRSH